MYAPGVTSSPPGGEPKVLDTAESIIIDGANGVTPAPRHAFPDAGVSLGLAVLVVVATLALRRRPFTTWALPVLLLLAAVPGLVHVVALRADAPLARPVLAAKVDQTLDAMQHAVPWPRPVHVAREEDDVLYPFVRYAVPSRSDSAPGVIELEVAGEHLPAKCRVEAPSGRVFCGDAP